MSRTLRAAVMATIAVAPGAGLAVGESGAMAGDTGSSCVRQDWRGENVWKGSPTPALDALAETLQQYANENMDDVAGVAFCSDYSGLEIYVKTSRAVEEVGAIVANSGQQVRIVPSSNSLNDLLAAGQRLLDESPDVVRGAGPDPISGGLVVTARSSGLSGSALEEIVQGVTGGIAVRVRSGVLASTNSSGAHLRPAAGRGPSRVRCQRSTRAGQ